MGSIGSPLEKKREAAEPLGVKAQGWPKGCQKPYFMMDAEELRKEVLSMREQADILESLAEQREREAADRQKLEAALDLEYGPACP